MFVEAIDMSREAQPQKPAAMTVLRRERDIDSNQVGWRGQQPSLTLNVR